MAARLDEIDKRIVDLMILNGRISSTDIARELGDVSERSVRYRLDRLMKEGIIKVSVIVQPEKIGYAVIGDVFMEVEPGFVMEVARKVAEYDQVSYVASSIGETDISVQIVAHNNAELYQFVTQVLGKIQGVRKTTTSIVPFKVKDVYQWRIPPDAVTDKS